MPTKRSGAVDGLLTELQRLIGPETETYSAEVLRGRIAQALEGYRTARTHHALDLPWHEQRIDPTSAEPGRDYEVISHSGYLIGKELTAGQAKAIASLGIVYGHAFALLTALRDDHGEMAIDGDALMWAANLMSALIEAGWCDRLGLA